MYNIYSRSKNHKKQPMRAYSNMNLKRNFSSQLRFSFTAELSRNQMDNETNRLADTIHPELHLRLLSTGSTTNRRTGRLTEVNYTVIIMGPRVTP